VNEYDETVHIRLHSQQFGLPVTLKACPKYKRGAYYVGRIKIGTTEFKVKAICLVSCAGGRSWAAWDERLDKKLEKYDVCSSMALPVQITIGLGVVGDYFIIIHPCGESDVE